MAQLALFDDFPYPTKNRDLIEPQEFDEKKSEDCNNIEKIAIDTTFVDVDVNVSVCNSSKIEAHFYGVADISIYGYFIFDVSVVNHELRITLKFSGKYFNENLKLDVTLPLKTFKTISVNGSSADITLNEGVSTDYLKVETQSGNLKSNATVKNVFSNTINGDVELYINAIQGTKVTVFTKEGDISAKFSNIGHINLFTTSISGDVSAKSRSIEHNNFFTDVRNRRKVNRGFTADVYISTESGNIKIR